MIKLDDIELYKLPSIIKDYVMTIHPKNSNGFIIRLKDIINQHFERRRSYIIIFPKQIEIDKIEDAFSDFMMKNIVIDNDVMMKVTVLSINPINIMKQKEITEISITSSGETINPESLVKMICIDIIEQMNKHLVEVYMEHIHPELTMDDSFELEKYNEIINDINMTEIYEKYKYADVYVPINIKSNDIKNTFTFYINGTILTSANIIDIVNDIRNCLDSNDTSEIFEYNKNEIIFKYANDIKVKSFEIITNAQPFEINI